MHHISFDANSQLEMIDNSAFSYCSSLLSIMLPESLKKINEYAFSNCYQLGKILIPHSIEKIGHFAFSNCYKLSSVVFYWAYAKLQALTNTCFLYTSRTHGQQVFLQNICFLCNWKSFNLSEYRFPNFMFLYPSHGQMSPLK